MKEKAMSAPEKIWYEPKYGVATEEPQNFDDAEYIRYDIHLAALKQARENIEHLTIAAYSLAMDCLQSTRYATDTDYKAAVDDVLGITGVPMRLAPPSDGGEGERK